jgi:hypothetical protein
MLPAAFMVLEALPLTVNGKLDRKLDKTGPCPPWKLPRFRLGWSLQRQLLMAVEDIAGVVDVERNGRRLTFKGNHPLVNERPCEADRVFQRRRILQPRQRRLRTQSEPVSGSFPQASLKAGSVRRKSRSSASS